MKLVFLGPPGAGKGTIADLAVKALGLPHISTGDLFRAAVKNGTPLGLAVKDIMTKGGLVPDELTIELVKERLAQSDAAQGWILDGFPRTIPQAEALEEISGVDRVANFDVPDEVVVSRLSGRRVCRTSDPIKCVSLSEEPGCRARSRFTISIVSAPSPMSSGAIKGSRTPAICRFKTSKRNRYSVFPGLRLSKAPSGITKTTSASLESEPKKRRAVARCVI
jgi:adenylate kinase family enzyme